MCVSTGVSPLPSGVRDIDSTKVDALTADDEESGKAEQRHSTADHGQLCCFSFAQFQLLNYVPS